MKNIIFAALLLSSIKVIAQNFEGTIKWTIRTEITDPKQKAQMEEAQKRMSDPATQAQMKQMQEKMNDPQFKAMMEANPQMKAQMEKMLGATQSGDMSSLVPKGFVVKIKSGNTLTKIEGGMFASDILYLKAKDQAYSLDMANRTYSIMNPASAASATKDADIKVTKTSETAKILNYNCAKYIVDVTKNGTKTSQYLWTTTEIKDIDLTSLSKQSFGKGQNFFYENVEGVPLRIETKTNGVNINMEVTEVKKESLNAADFVIPADFKEVAGMFR
jgi:hypothetical protein